MDQIADFQRKTERSVDMTLRLLKLFSEEENYMKNKKVCALLCAVALSANIVLPVMAAENTDNIYTTEDGAMVEENQIAEPQGDAVTGNDTEGIEEQEQAGENANDVE